MQLEEAIKTRRSIRRYQDRDVPTELIMKALELACWAPNGGNFQPWKFYVVKNRELIGQIADAVDAKHALMAEWPDMGEFVEAINRFRSRATFFRAAPVLIVTTIGAYQSVADGALRRRGEADPAAAEMLRDRAAISARCQTIAGATAHLLLALHSLGLGACWMGGPMVARRQVAEILGIPPSQELFAVIPVGYPAENPTPGPRKPMEEVVQVIE